MPNDTFVAPLPTPGSGAYSTQINNAIEEIRDKLEPKVPTSAMNWDADVDFGNHALTDVSRVTCTAQSSVLTSFSIYCRGVDWYLRDGNGNEIRLTASGAINVASTDLNGSHGARFINHPPAFLATITGAPINFTNGRGIGSASAACSFYCTMPTLRRGSRILSVTGVFSTGVGVGTSAITLRRRNADNLAPTSVGTQSTGSTGAPLSVTISGLTETVGNTQSYVLEVATGRSQDALEAVIVEYDRP